MMNSAMHSFGHRLSYICPFSSKALMINLLRGSTS